MTEPIDPSITEHNGINVGDMVTTYHAGFHVMVGFAHYANNPTATIQCIYRRVADSTGQPCGGKPKSCHPSYIKKVDTFRLGDDQAYEAECLRLKYCALYGILRELEAKQ